MLLSECRLGEVVKLSTVNGYKLGHILGFAENSTKEVIVEVKQSNGDKHAIHPANLSLFKE